MNTFYKLFKNLLHNELHITKDDIQTMIREEVKKQVDAICEGRNGSRLEDMARDEIKKRVEWRIQQDLINDLTKRVKESVKLIITDNAEQ